MTRSRLALSALVLALSGAAGAAVAQPAPPAGPPGPPRMQGTPGMQGMPGGRMGAPRMSPEDATAFAEARAEARIAALRAGLKLTADQEKLWPPFEAALRNQARGRADWIAARRAEWASRMPPQGEPRQQVDPVQRMRQAAKLAATRADELTKIADAAEPLLKSLDENQLRRFNMLMRPGGGRFDGQRFERRGGWDGDRGGDWRRR